MFNCHIVNTCIYVIEILTNYIFGEFHPSAKLVSISNAPNVCLCTIHHVALFL